MLRIFWNLEALFQVLQELEIVIDRHQLGMGIPLELRSESYVLSHLQQQNEDQIILCAQCETVTWGPSIFVKWISVKLTVQVWYPSLQQCHQIWYSTLDIWIKEGPVSSTIFNISCFSGYLLFVLSLSKLKMGFSMYWVRVTKSDICCIYCLFEIFHTHTSDLDLMHVGLFKSFWIWGEVFRMVTLFKLTI